MQGAVLSEMLISAPHVSHTLNYSAEKAAAEREERRREEGGGEESPQGLPRSAPPPSHLSVLDPVGGWRC